jgi:hypothetical protein
LTHSKNESDNRSGEHSVAAHGFSFLPERLSLGKIQNMSKEVLGVETLPGRHYIDHVKFVNSLSHCQDGLFVLLVWLTLAGTSSRATLHFVGC